MFKKVTQNRCLRFQWKNGPNISPQVLKSHPKLFLSDFKRKNGQNISPQALKSHANGDKSPNPVTLSVLKNVTNGVFHN